MGEVAGLRVRKPTGRPAWPIIVIEGLAKSGKTYSAIQLTASKKVGRSFVFDLGDGAADEYASLGDFEIVETDGTWHDFIGQLRAACSLRSEDGKPNVVIIDSGSNLWDGLKVWLDKRARNSDKAKKILKDDPDAEIDITMNLWNDAKDRWGQMMHTLRQFNGIAIILARASVVAKVGPNGQPLANQTDYSVNIEKSTSGAVNAIVRVDEKHVCRVVGMWGLNNPGTDTELPAGNPIEHLVFDIMGGDFGDRQSAAVSMGMTVAAAKTKLMSLFAGMEGLDARTAAIIVWESAGITSQEVTDEQWAELERLAALHLADSPESVREEAENPNP